jgi:hypothetical protein
MRGSGIARRDVREELRHAQLEVEPSRSILSSGCFEPLAA